jgi:hypothetical protein
MGWNCGAGARFDWRISARLAAPAVAAHLIFFDLGGPWLEHEDTAAFARNIAATGCPPRDAAPS